VKGKGGHAAMPRSFTDNVLIASHVIVALQQITSRNADPAIPTVLSFGKVEAKGATNVIPGEVKIAGTFRTMDEEWRNEAHGKINRIATTVAEGMGASCRVEIKKGYPFLVNHPELTEKARTSAIEILGNENVEKLDIRMTAEDFAYFSQRYPSMMYRLGVMKKGEKESPGLHTPVFDVDEHALRTGMETMSWIALSLLK
jgi:amidohydrolase